jgi:hypothetical protein
MSGASRNIYVYSAEGFDSEVHCLLWYHKDGDPSAIPKSVLVTEVDRYNNCTFSQTNTGFTVKIPALRRREPDPNIFNGRVASFQQIVLFHFGVIRERPRAQGVCALILPSLKMASCQFIHDFSVTLARLRAVRGWR